MGTDAPLFLSLFNHISRSQIEMTAPVVMAYDREVIDARAETGDVSMEFLYRTSRQGTAGAVKVEDRPAAVYGALGVQGGMSPQRLCAELATLEDRLNRNAKGWVPDGPPRFLGYHGPMTPEPERLWEVQVPVRPAAGAGGAPKPGAGPVEK